MIDPRRDIDQECGYPLTITTEQYVHAFRRWDVANRVVSLYPEESWALSPAVFETEEDELTEFEKGWDSLVTEFSIFSILQRADVMSGIGTFGILLLGLDDGKGLDLPAAGIDDRGVPTPDRPQHKILYLRAFDESVVRINKFEGDIRNPRYGLPMEYQVQFTDTSLGTAIASSTTVSVNVHWTRVIHLADNRTNSEIYGAPRMEKVFERLLDLRKISAGSGEMFWKGGFPGYSLEATPGLEENLEFDEDATKEQMEAYMNGLQRYIATIGMQVKSLSVQIADPRPHIETQVRLIAMAVGVPWRILMGVEVGQLASEQDIESWNKRLDRRRKEYIVPYILRPFIDRLMGLGILARPAESLGYTIEWADLNSPKDQDKAAITEKRTNALSKYVADGIDNLIPPFYYLTLFQGLTQDEARSVIAAAETQMTAGGLLDEVQDVLPANRTGEPQMGRDNGEPATTVET